MARLVSLRSALLLVASLGVMGAAPSARAAGPRFFPGHVRDRAASPAQPMVRPEGHPGIKPFAMGDPTQCGQASYCGGPVISNVELVPVFWPGVAAQTVSWATTYGQAITNSDLMDMLSQYSTAGVQGYCPFTAGGMAEYGGPATPFSTGQTITRGTGKQGVQLQTLLVATGTSITDDSATIGEEIIAQIGAGVLPEPTYDAQGYPNTLYMVFFPQSITINLGGLKSCQGFGGYHYSVSYSAQAACAGQYLPYAVIPSCGATGSQLTIDVSHELAEAVTDTDVGPTLPTTSNYGDLGWYLGPTSACTVGNGSCNDPTCGEVGDVCVQYGTGKVPGTTVSAQYIWSEATSNCMLYDSAIGVQTAPTSSTTVCVATSTSTSSSSSSTSTSSSSSTSSTSSSTGSSSGGTGGSASSSSGGTGGSSGTGGHGTAGGSTGNDSGCHCSVPSTDGSASARLVAGLLGLGVVVGRRRRGDRRKQPR